MKITSIFRKSAQSAKHKDPVKGTDHKEVPLGTPPYGNVVLSRDIKRKLTQLYRDRKVLDRGAMTASASRAFEFCSQFDGSRATITCYTQADPLLKELDEKIKRFTAVKYDLVPHPDFSTVTIKPIVQLPEEQQSRVFGPQTATA